MRLIQERPRDVRGDRPRAVPSSRALPPPRRTSARVCPFRPDCPGGTAARLAYAEFWQLMSCQNSAETEILLDHTARPAGAAHQPAQGPHGHRTPLKPTACRATGAGQSGTGAARRGAIREALAALFQPRSAPNRVPAVARLDGVPRPRSAARVSGRGCLREWRPGARRSRRRRPGRPRAARRAHAG